MKQIQTFILIMIICMQCITTNLKSMQPLQQELQNLNVSLQTLENKLQGSSTAPIPPPAPTYQKTTGPKFYKAKHYEYTTPSGKKLDVVFGIINVNPDINNPAYSFIMYGPELKQKPNENTFNAILFGIRQETGKDILTFYPDIANENIKTEYSIINGKNESEKSKHERAIKNKLDNLKNEYEKLQKQFSTNYQAARVLGDPNNKQVGSIFGTSFDADKIYVQELINFFNDIEADEKGFYAIQNSSFFDNILIPALTEYFTLIKNFKDKVDEFMARFGDITGTPKLGATITKNKFGVEELLPINPVKINIAQAYYDTIKKPIEDIFTNFNNILNETLKAQHEQLSKRPISEVRKYYNNLLSVAGTATITPTRDITQALQQTGAGTSQPDTTTRQGYRKTGIEIFLEQERLKREAKEAKRKAKKQGKKKPDEWEDDEDDAGN